MHPGASTSTSFRRTTQHIPGQSDRNRHTSTDIACIGCAQLFTQIDSHKTLYERHLQNTHRQNRYFRYSEILNENLPEYYSCTECRGHRGKIAEFSCALSNHIVGDKNNKNHYICGIGELCSGAAFPNPELLIEHWESEHCRSRLIDGSQYRKYLCRHRNDQQEICMTSFENGLNHKIHERTHIWNNDTFKCYFPSCEYVFLRPWLLTEHIESYHASQFSQPVSREGDDSQPLTGARENISNTGAAVIDEIVAPTSSSTDLMHDLREVHSQQMHYAEEITIIMPDGALLQLRFSIFRHGHNSNQP